MSVLFKFMLTLIICVLFNISHVVSAEPVIIQNNGFKYIPIFENKALLIKEIPLNKNLPSDYSYTTIRNWVKKQFTTDVFYNSILYLEKDMTVFVKSRVELLLPLFNNRNENKTALMQYQLVVSIIDKKCVMEITNINYKLKHSDFRIKEKLPAEMLVTPQALTIKDAMSIEREEILKNTLFYFNNLADTLSESLLKTHEF